MFFTGPDGERYRFFFRHSRYEHPKEALAMHMRALKGKEVPVRAVTHCIVVSGPKDAEQPVGEGQAWCSVLDQYNKETGRSIAVKRAAQKVPAELRVPLLTAYFARKRGKTKRPSNAAV